MNIIKDQIERMKQNQNQSPTKLASIFLTVQNLVAYIRNHPLSKEIPQKILKQFVFLSKRKLIQKNPYKHSEYEIQRIMKLAYGKKGNKCEMLIGQKLYICYDCQVNSQAWMCEKCFIEAGHHLHCRFAMKELDEKFRNVFVCVCGDYDLISCKGTCSQHSKLSIKPPVCHLLQTEKQSIKSDIIGYFKILIVCLQTNSQKKFGQCKLLTDFTSFYQLIYQKTLLSVLSQSIKKTSQYTQLIQECLLQQLPLEYFSSSTPNPTILTYLLSKISFVEDLSFARLLQQLLQYNSKKFIYVLIQDCLLAQSSVRNRKVKFISKLKRKNVFRSDILCEMLLEMQKTHQLFNVNDIEFYTSGTCPNLCLHKQERKTLYLLPYWQFLQQTKQLTIQKIVQKKIPILQILTITMASPKIFSSVLKKLIRYTYKKITANQVEQNETKGCSINIISMSQIISKSILAFVQGNYHQIYTFLDTLTVTKKLSFILFCYFRNVVENAALINHQAAFTFGVYLGYLQARRPLKYQDYVKMWQGKDIQSEKMIDFMAKISHTTFGQQLKHLAKIKSYKQLTGQQRSQVQKRQQKKLKELLYMQKKFPKKQLQMLLKENLLNFTKAGHIMNTYTQYDQQSDCFIYNSKEDHSSFDWIFNYIFDLSATEVENLVFDNQYVGDWGINEHNFQVRKFILSGIMKPFLEGDQKDIYLVPSSQAQDSYKIVQSQFQYAKFICLITIDKYVDGKIASLRNYLISKRKQLCKQTRIHNLEKETQIMRNKLQKILGCLSPNNMTEDTEKKVQNKTITINQDDEDEKIEQRKEQNKMIDIQENEEFVKIEQQQIVKIEYKIEIESTKTQVVPLDIRSQQKQKPESVQTTPNSKLQRLKQQFKKKQESVLNMYIDSSISPSKPNAQTCMTCKQQGYYDNALFYLGTIKKQDQQWKIFENSDYSASHCMHLMHSKCFLKVCQGNSVNCPLCSTSSNMIFPHQNEQLSPRTLQFFESRLLYIIISSSQQYHQNISLMFMLRTITFETVYEIILSILLLGDSAQQGIIKNIVTQKKKKKNKYYLQLIRKWWDGLEQCERDVELLKINRQSKDKFKEKGMMESDRKQRNPKIIMDWIVKSVIWNQIYKSDISAQLHCLLVQLGQLMNPQQFTHFLEKLQEITPNPISFAPCMNKKGSKKLIQYYLTPPQRLYYLQVHKRCPKCVKEVPTYYCLQCNMVYCNDWDHGKTHNYPYLRIECASGYIQSKGQAVQSNTIVYFNQFHQPWKSVQYAHDDYFAYVIDYSALAKAVALSIANIRT